jgi:hypothetical protein
MNMNDAQEDRRYAVLMETSGEECESWYYSILYNGNEENLTYLQSQLESVKWRVDDGMSTFDLDLEHLISEKTAKELTKLELNHCFFHRKFDGSLQKIELNFKSGDKNKRKIKKAFELLGYGRIEDFIDQEDIDAEDLADPNEIVATSSDDDDDESSSDDSSDDEEEETSSIDFKRLKVSDTKEESRRSNKPSEKELESIREKQKSMREAESKREGEKTERESKREQSRREQSMRDPSQRETVNEARQSMREVSRRDESRRDESRNIESRRFDESSLPSTLRKKK